MSRQPVTKSAAMPTPNWTHLRAWRRAQRLTLLYVAETVGTTHSTVLRWEKGKQAVPPEKFDERAQVYGCTTTELSYDPNDRARGALEHAAIRLARDLPLDKVEAWVAVGRAMAR